MPEGYFEVFNLYVIDDYAHEEIAQLLNITEALSRKRLSRAKAWLKKTIEALNCVHILVIHYSLKLRS